MDATNAIRIKGVTIGEGAPKTIVSILSADEEGLVEEARRAADVGADCVEWRADYFGEVWNASRLAQVVRAIADVLPRTPLVFTIRSKAQGGRVDMDAAEYADLVGAVVEDGRADIVDLELCAGDDTVRELASKAREQGMHSIVSHHDFCGTPEVGRMAGLLAHMAELGASIPKLATMARSPLDALRLMEATAQVTNRIPNPLLTIAMGSAGTLSRLCGEVFGSALTFCALGSASAPGQVELTQARVLIDQLHAILVRGDNTHARA